MRKLWVGIKSFFACGWSAATYVADGMPDDKEIYWRNQCDFADTAPNLVESFANYAADPSYHHLKDIMVEWTKVWPQRAAKLIAMFGMGLFLTGLGIGCITTILIMNLVM